MTKEELLDQIINCYTRMWGSEFNVFHWIALDKGEVNHSTLIKSLLNRKGIHECNDAFLKIFMDILKKADPKISSFIDDFDTNESTAETEHSAPALGVNGRIDIFIKGKSIKQHSKKAIIIENKLDADDQDAQLVRYDEWAHSKGKMDKNDYIIIYLTLDGHIASSKSSTKPDGSTLIYTCISYLEDIMPWLDACIKYIDEKGKEESLMRLRMCIKQYREYLERIVVRDQILKKAVDLYRKNNDQKDLDEIIKDLQNHPDALMKIKKSEIIDDIKKKLSELWKGSK